MNIQLTNDSTYYDVQMIFGCINKFIENPNYDEDAKKQMEEILNIIGDRENFVQIIKRIVSGKRNTSHREMLFEIVKTARSIKTAQEKETIRDKWLRQRIAGKMMIKEEEEPIKPNEIEIYLIRETTLRFDSFFSIILCVATHEAFFYKTQTTPLGIPNWENLLETILNPKTAN